MGDLYSALGQGEAAREAYLKSLQIIERVAQAEPDRADYQVDLAISLARIGSAESPLAREPLERALAILLTLQKAGRLAPEHEPKIADLQQMLST
jgi:hypothetical protein